MGCWNAYQDCGIFEVAVKGEDALMDPIERKSAAEVIDKESEFTSATDDDEPTEEEIRASVRRSMQQALSGETRPADDALEEIRRELAAYADARQDN